MNKIYRTVYNETTRTWVAVEETAKSHRKSGGVVDKAHSTHTHHTLSGSLKGKTLAAIAAAVACVSPFMASEASAAEQQVGILCQRTVGGKIRLFFEAKVTGTTCSTGTFVQAVNVNDTVTSPSFTNNTRPTSGSSTISIGYQGGFVYSDENGNDTYGTFQRSGLNSTPGNITPINNTNGNNYLKNETPGATGDNDIAIGTNATAHGDRKSKEGVDFQNPYDPSDPSQTPYSFDVSGYYDTTGGAGRAIAIGQESQAVREGAIAVGWKAMAGKDAIAIGNNITRAVTPNSIAIGYEADIHGQAGLNTAWDNPSQGGSSIAFGNGASNYTHGSSNRGNDYYANTRNSIAIGYKAHTHAANAFAIGVSTDAIAERAFAIGTAPTGVAGGHQGSLAAGQGSVVIGDQAWSMAHRDTYDDDVETNTHVNDSVAVGTMSLAQARNSLALGGGVSYTYHDITYACEKESDGSCKTDGEGNTVYNINQPTAMNNITRYYDGTDWQDATEKDSTGKLKLSHEKGLGAAVRKDADGAIALGGATGDEIIDSSNDYYPTSLPTVGHYIQAAEVSEGAKRAIAMGSGTKVGAKSKGAVALGGDTVKGNSAVHASKVGEESDSALAAIGGTVGNYATGAIAVGNNALVDNNSTGSVALGGQGDADYQTKIGTGASNAFAAIGGKVANNATGAIAVGNNAQVNAQNQIAIGTNAIVDGDGTNPSDKGKSYGNIAIGVRAHTRDYSENQIAIGKDATTQGIGAIALGSQGTYANDKGSIAIGNQAKASKDQSIAIGQNVNYDRITDTATAGRQSIAIGAETQSKGIASIAIGGDDIKNDSGVTLDSDVPTGEATGTTATGNVSMAIGLLSQSGGAFSQAIGYKNTTGDSATNSIALGYKNTVTGANSTAIGQKNEVRANNSGAFGDPNVIELSADNSYVIGNNNTVTTGNDKVFILGNNVKMTAANSVFLGDSAKYIADGTSSKGLNTYSTNADIKDIYGNMALGSGSLTFAGATPTGVVSVGDGSLVRRIQNVAAGLIDEKSTDAINGSQLYAVVQNLKTNIATDNRNVGVATLGGTQTVVSPYIDVDDSNDISGKTESLESYIKNQIALDSTWDSLNDVQRTNKINQWTNDFFTADAQGKQFAQATGTNAIAIGNSAKATVNNATAIGSSAQATGTGATAVGNSAQATVNNATAIGNSAQATGTGATAIGNNSRASGGNSVALMGNNITGTRAIGWGNGVTASGTDATAFGSGTQATGNRSTAFGWQTQATENRATAFGFQTESSGESSTAFGHQTKASGMTATAFGQGTQATSQHATAFGYNTQATNHDATAFGKETTASGQQSTAFGLKTIASGDYATAWGQGAVAEGHRSTAWGYNNQAKGTNATVWGLNSEVAGGTQGATAFGSGSHANADNSLAALGGTTTTGAAGSAAIGSGATVSQQGTVALGSDSVADRASGMTGEDPLNSGVDTTSPVWTANANAIAVGNGTTTTRQITGVAAGKVDTDAVNVAQLKVVANESHLKFAGDDGQTDTSKVITRKNTQQLDIVGGATGSFTTDDNIGVNRVDDHTLKVQLAENVNLGSSGSLTMGTSGTNLTTITPNSIAFSSNNGVITNVKSHLVSATNQTSNPSTSVTASNEAATVFDVMNAGWNLQDNDGNAVDFVAHGDTVKFLDGKGSTVTAVSPDKKTSTVKYDVNIKHKDSNKYVKVVDPNSTSNFYEIDDSAIDTAVTTVTTAITNAGFNLKTTKSTGGDVDNTAITDPSVGEKIKNGETVTLDAGKNIKITQTTGGNVRIAAIDTTMSVASTGKVADIATDDRNKLTTAQNVADMINQTYWIAKDGGTGVANVHAGDEVTLKPATGENNIQVALTPTTGGGGAYEFKLKDGTGLTPNANGTVTASSTGDILNAGQVADAINKSGFTVNADKTGSGTNSTTPTSTLVKTGEEVKFVAGNGVDIAQNGKDFTFAVNENFINNTVKPLTFSGDDSGVKLTPNHGENVQVRGIATTAGGTNKNITVTTNKTNGSLDIALNPNVDLGNSGSLKVRNFNVNADGTTTYNTTVNPSNGTEVVNVNYANTLGWNIAGDDKAVQGKVVNGNQVNFINGKGTQSTVTYSSGTAEVKYDVNLADKKTTGNEYVKVDYDAGSNTYQIDDSAISTALGNTGFTLKTKKSDGEVSNTGLESGDEINNGESVTLDAGKNIKLTQSANGNVSIATKDDVTFNKVTATTIDGSTVNATTLNAGNKFNVSGDSVTYDVDNTHYQTASNSTVVNKGYADSLGWDLQVNGTKQGETITNGKAVNFANGNNTTMKYEGGAVKVDVNTTALTTTDGKVDNLATGEEGKLTTAQNVADMINQTYWIAQDGNDTGTAGEQISAGGKVVFQSADGSVTVKRTSNSFDFKVNKGADPSISTTDGTVSGGVADTYWDSKQVENAINQSGWIITSSTAGSDEQLVQAGGKVDLKAGSGVKIEQSGKDFTFSVDNSTLNAGGNKPLEFIGDTGETVSPNFGETVKVVGEEANVANLTSGNIGVVGKASDNSLTIKLNKDIDLGDSGSLKVAKTTINQADGVTTNALRAGDSNVFQVAGNSVTYNRTIPFSETNGYTVVNKAYVDSGRTVVKEGKNVPLVTPVTDTATGQTTYTVDAIDTQVSAGSGLKMVSSQDPNAGNDYVRKYELGLSDENQGKIDNALSSLKTRVVKGGTATDAQSLDKTQSNADFIQGDNIELTAASTGITIATAKDVKFDSVETTDLTVTGNTVLQGNTTIAGNTTITGNTTYTGAITDNNHIVNKGYADGLGWNIAGDDKAVQGKVVNGNQVNFVNGKGTQSTVTYSGSTAEVKYDVNIADKDAGGNQYVTVAYDAGSNTYQIDDSALDTAISTAVNDAKFTLTSANKGANTGVSEEVKNGSTVTINGGSDNIAILQSGGTITVDTAKAVKFDSVETGTLKAGDTQLGDNFEVKGGKVTYNQTPTDDNEVVNKKYADSLGWDLEVNGTKQGDTITNGKAVNFADGDNTTVKFESGAVKVNVNTTTLTATDGKVNNPATGGNNLTTAQNVADMINQSYWTAQDGNGKQTQVKAGDPVTWTGGKYTEVALTGNTFTVNSTLDIQQNAAGDVVIKDGDTVLANIAKGSDTVTSVAAGDNIVVTPDMTDPVNPKYTVALNKDVALDKGSITITGDTNTVNITGDKVDMGGNKIENVAAGVDDTDAVNVGQLKQVTNIVTGGKDSVDIVTYNVQDRGEHHNQSVIEAIDNINAQGIQFFHTNQTGVTLRVDQTNDQDSSAAGAYATAIGVKANASEENTLAMGHGATASAVNAIAIGNGTQATGEKSISIGAGNIVSGARSGAIGDPNVITGSDSWALGNENTISTNNTHVVGNNVKTTADNSVFLGNNTAYTAAGASTAGTGEYAANHEDIKDVNGNVVIATGELKFAGSHTDTGVVSVGDIGNERRIQNVAPGKLSADSTDAINGSQLYSVAQKVGQVSSGGAGIVQYSNPDDPTTPNGGVATNDVTLVGADKAAPVTIHNVAAGRAPTDAVNVSQLQQVAGDIHNRIGDVSKHADASAASAIAVASMPQAFLPGKNLVAIGGGTYHGQTGYAIGFSTISDNGHWIVKGTATGNSKNRYGAGVGAGYQW
ncbi:MAG: YadA-like family protein [Neisseriaceae bacterium]|nr:YadA-like family protein [Neisseriaceae bacterium]